MKTWKNVKNREKNVKKRKKNEKIETILICIGMTFWHDYYAQSLPDLFSARVYPLSLISGYIRSDKQSAPGGPGVQESHYRESVVQVNLCRAG